MKPVDDASGPFISSFMAGENGSSKKKLWMLLGGVVLVAAIIVVTALLMRNPPKTEGIVKISDKVAHVRVESSGYLPMTIKIKQGQEVTWTNQEATPHRLAADLAVLPGFETSEPLNQGDSYTYIFLKKGTYRYYDPDAPKRYVGTVVVE